MALGTLGKEIAFEVTDDKIYTFDKLSRSVKWRTAKHEVIGAKPILEGIGPDLSEISFQMSLSASNTGINPIKSMESIYDAYAHQTPMIFMIGNRVIGDYKWVITEFDEHYDGIDSSGSVWKMTVDIKLTEYVETIGDPQQSQATEESGNAEVVESAIDESGSDEDGDITGDGDGGENPTTEEDDQTSSSEEDEE